MESFNKVLYFILGLVVVLVFIIVFTGRLNLGKNFRPLAGNTTLTPTPKVQAKKGFFSFLGGQSTVTPSPAARPSATPTPMPYMMPESSKGNVSQPIAQKTTKGAASNVQTIPATGSPVQILLFSIPALSAGLYLRKRS